MEFAAYSPKTSALKLGSPWMAACVLSFFAVLASQGRILSGKTGGEKGKRFAKMTCNFVALP